MSDVVIRQKCEAGSFADAATAALQEYGGELMAFLVAITRNEDDADDAFSLFCVAMLRGLPAFRWQSSLRTWLYVLARSSLGRLARERAAARLEVPLTPDLEAALVKVKTTRGVSTTKRDRLAALRDSLDPEDHMLLVLRVTRELSWRDIARIMAGDDDLPPDEEQRVTSALRKRWQRLKDDLRRELERA